ncbi:MAG: AMP-binding protein, partial [Desulfobacterales bacterium]|nr:AMP-binding protein [Desulfobacterales bacterium]
MEISRKHSSDFTRLFDILSYQREKYPNQRALNAFEAGSWNGLSISEIQEKVDSVSCWFIRSGYVQGQSVMFVPVMGSPAWMILDFACQQCGLVTIPIHPTTSSQDLELVISETEAKICIAANMALFETIKTVTQKMNASISLHHLEQTQLGYFEPFRFVKPNEVELQKLESIRNSIDEHALSTILYTSGSAGVPKGVQLTHRNIVCNIKAVLTLLPLGPGHKVLSYLPFSHILERVACYGYMAFGVSLYFSQRKESFEHDFRTVQPFFCTSVPRVLEKMHDFLQQQLLKKNKLKRALIAWALAVGKQFGEKKRLNGWYGVKLFFARILVLNRWRKK